MPPEPRRSEHPVDARPLAARAPQARASSSARAPPSPSCSCLRSFSRARRRRASPRPSAIANPLAQMPDRELGADLPRPVRRGRLVRLHVRAERHAQLPAPRAREERRHRPDQPDVRVRARRRTSYGNQASHRWDPRICQKGLILGRRIYGDRRVKAPMIRKGFKEWVDAGFPRNDDGTPKYGHDEARLRRVAADLVGRGARDRREDDRERRRDLQRRGRAPRSCSSRATSPRWSRRCTAPGVQAIKMRGGMPLLGVGRVFGFYRFANMLALLDRKLRPDAPPEEIVGSRAFDNYAWHTDLPPGHPDGDRQPDGRLRPLRGRALEAARAHRDELDLHEDAGRALDRRRAPQGHAGRRDHAPTTCRRRTRPTRS